MDTILCSVFAFTAILLSLTMAVGTVNTDNTTCDGPFGRHHCLTHQGFASCVFVQNHSAVDHVLTHELPQNITGLNLTFCDGFDMPYPYVEPAINLTALRSHRNLHTLILTPPACMGTPFYMKNTPLVIGSDTFVGSNLSHIQINIPIIAQDNREAFKNMPNITTLDLKWTMSLGYQNLSNLFSVLPADKLTMVNISRFQTAGRPGYSAFINIPELFGGKNQSALTVLDLSWNGITFISQGISSYAPNLEYLDVSHNVLVDNSNSPLLMEYLLLLNLKITQCYKSEV